MEQILVIISDEWLLGEVNKLLMPEFKLTYADSVEEGSRIIDAHRNEIAVVLLELELAKRSDMALLGQMRGSTLLETIPLVGVSPRPYTEEDREIAEHGFYDLITLLSPPWLTVKRIRNAARTKEALSYTEMERMLQALPSRIFLKDNEGRYVFNTTEWNHFHRSAEPGWTIRGKTDLEVRNDKVNAQKAMDSDRKILETGKSDTYIIKEHEDGRDEYYELVKCPTRDADGSITGIVATVSNVTERFFLRRELEKLSRTDSLTELLNKRTSEELTRRVLQECLEKGTHCALLMIDADYFKRVNDTFGHATGDQVLATIGRVLRESSRSMDVTGRVGGDEFIMLLRDIPSAEAACATAERIKNSVEEAFRNDPLSGYVTLSIGIAIFPEHGAEFNNLYRAADHALYDRKENGKDGYSLYRAEE